MKEKEDTTTKFVLATMEVVVADADAVATATVAQADKAGMVVVVTKAVIPSTKTEVDKAVARFAILFVASALVAAETDKKGRHWRSFYCFEKVLVYSF